MLSSSMKVEPTKPFKNKTPLVNDGDKIHVGNEVKVTDRMLKLFFSSSFSNIRAVTHF